MKKQDYAEDKMLPDIEELRASQKKGSEGTGMNPPDTKLNEEQGHEVEIRR